MHEDIRHVLLMAEQSAASGRVNETLAVLRRLVLMDFGELLLAMPSEEFPYMSRILPRMASDEVQNAWTGASGRHLLTGTVDFVRMVQMQYERLSRRPLQGGRVLDFGCGYGRIARLMYWFTDPENYVGVDPWDRSLELCEADGLLGTFVQSDYVPETLPVGDKRFDLIFAFSVFTHTSLRVTMTALRTLRRYVRNTGVLAFTIRPVEFWDGLGRILPEERVARAEEHRRGGFAFDPISFPRLGDELIFGDTTIDPKWIAANFPEWELEGYDRGLDNLQTCIFLTPR